MTGKLTTHVLDTAQGAPAVGMTIELWQITGDRPEKALESDRLLKTIITNSDGRTDAPLLNPPDFAVGIYELRFAVGSYFTAHLSDLPDPPFLGIVPIRFGIADPLIHYHVPLLCSPWSYSTYRGS